MGTNKIEPVQCIVSFMGNPFIDLFFPRFCIGCGYLGTYICPACEKKIKKINTDTCFYCGKQSLLGFTHPPCRQEKGVDGYLSLYSYEGLFVKILQVSKYKGAFAVLNTLLSYPQSKTIQKLKKWGEIFKPLMISVPLHKQRLKERGFNQSEIIRGVYSDKTELLNEDLLERVINTTHLANIKDKRKRKKSVKGAFRFIGKNTPSTVLLIDDVITSGSTILECSKTLKEKGVQTVLAFSLAKG